MKICFDLYGNSMFSVSMECRERGVNGTKAISIHALNHVAVAKSIDIEFVYIHHAKAKLSKLLIKTVILKSVTLRWVF